jgi:hypothetical protein
MTYIKLVLLAVISTCFVPIAMAQQGSTNAIPALEGRWVLDSVEGKRITTSGDTIDVLLSEFKSEIITSIDFNTSIPFTCELVIDDNIIMSKYTVDITNFFLEYNNTIKPYRLTITKTNKKQMNILRNIAVGNELDPSILDYMLLLNLQYHESN